MRQTLKQVGSWTATAFSENGVPSSSRILTALHSLISSFVLTYVSVKTKAVPDATVLGGLGIFATVHYAVNSAKSAVQSFSKNPVVPNPNQTTGNMNPPPADNESKIN